MKRLTSWLLLLRGRQDIILAVLLIVVVFMMILPMPTLIIDILIAINLTFSVILLMIAIYTREPLEFSAFPAVLLITTLYRLSLSISTTRSILLKQDAGDIVYMFGNFVVGGNLAVGLIIFSIITIVQFIVITKGSERVAEVGARFSLDGMPGKQMSIDGDMRAGMIDAAEAKRQRGLVQKESQLYGAMDGAMKFVKGDAISGIIIILVNILGGIGIGVFQYDMSAAEAVGLYSVLSIGDGLIAQIPALLISITAGIIVTRVPGEERKNLAVDLSDQLGRQPQPLVVAGTMLLFFGMLPGFPKLVFFSLSAILIASSYFLKRSQKNKLEREAMGEGEAGEEIKLGAVPLLILLPKQLHTSELKKSLDMLAWNIFERLGLNLPRIEIKLDTVSKDNLLTIQIYQETVCKVTLLEDHHLIKWTSETVPPNFLKPTATLLAESNVFWIDVNDMVKCSETDFSLYENEQRIIYYLNRTIVRYAKEFIGIQETRFLMDSMESRYAELIKELQRQVPLGKVAEILQRLIEEGISIRDLRSIFEALISWASKEKDVVILTEYVRLALRRHIIAKYQTQENSIEGFLIGNTIEAMVRESIRQTSNGSYSTLAQTENRAILDKIYEALNGKTTGILFTALDIRRYIRKIVEQELFDVSVLSFQEISDFVSMNILGNIELFESR